MNFDVWEQETLAYGEERWRSALRFYSHEYVKAGLLRKRQGKWEITPEGTRRLADGPEAMFAHAREAYLAWRRGDARRDSTRE